MCSDRDADWYPQATWCSATAAQAAATALFHMRHEKQQYHDGTWLPGASHWSSKRSAKFPFHRDDGLTIFVSPTELGLGADILTGKAPDEPEGSAVLD